MSKDIKSSGGEGKPKKLQRSAQKQLLSLDVAPPPITGQVSAGAVQQQSHHVGAPPRSTTNVDNGKALPSPSPSAGPAPGSSNKGQQHESSVPAAGKKNPPFHSPAAGNQNSNSGQKIQTPAKSTAKGPSTSQKIQICLQETLEKYNYVVANQVIELYRKKYTTEDSFETEDIHKLVEIRYLRDVNIEINSSVDAYYYSTPVKLVFDCEAFVLKQVNSWLKNVKRQPTANTFEDLGVGNFLYNPYVQQKFGYKLVDIPNLPRELTLDDIVTAYLDILAGSVNKSIVVPKTSKGPQKTLHVDIPEKKMGFIIGPQGSNMRLIEDQAGVALTISGNKLSIRGGSENVVKGEELVEKILNDGVNALKLAYQERFEQRLRFILQSKYNVENVNALGVLIDAKGLHHRLVEHTKDFTAVYKSLSQNYAEQLRNSIPKLWDEWTSKQRDQLVRKSDKASSNNYLRDHIGETTWKLIQKMRNRIPNNASTSIKSIMSSVVKELPLQDLSSFFSDHMTEDVFWNADGIDTIPIHSHQMADFGSSLFALINPMLNFMMWLPLKGSKTDAFKELSVLEMISMKDMRNLDSYLKILAISKVPDHVQQIAELLIKQLANSATPSVTLGPSQSSISCNIEKIDHSERIGLLEDVCFSANVKIAKGKIGVTISDIKIPLIREEKYPLKAFVAITLCEGLSDDDNFIQIGVDDEAQFVSELKKFNVQCSVLFVFHNSSITADKELSHDLIESLRTNFGVNLGSITIPKGSGVRFVYGYHKASFPLEMQVPTEGKTCKLKLIERKYLSTWICIYGLAFRLLSHLMFLHETRPDIGVTKIDEFSICELIDVVDFDLEEMHLETDRSVSNVFACVASFLDHVEDTVLRTSGHCSFDMLKLGSFTHVVKKSNAIRDKVLLKLFGDLTLIVSHPDQIATSSIDHMKSHEVGSHFKDTGCKIEWSVLSDQMCCLFDAHLQSLEAEGISKSLLDIFADIESKLLQDGFTGFQVIDFGEKGRSFTLLQLLKQITESVGENEDMKDKLLTLCSRTGRVDTACIGDIVEDAKVSTASVSAPLDPKLSRLYEICYLQLLLWSQSRNAIITKVSETSEVDIVSNAVRNLLVKDRSTEDEKQNNFDLHRDNLSRNKLNDAELNLLFISDTLQQEVDESHVLVGESLDGDGTVVNELSGDNRKALVELLFSRPYGSLCSKSLNLFYIQKHLGKTAAELARNIPLLLFELRSEIHENESKNKKFMIISGKDAMVVPNQLPAKKDITDALQSRSTSLILAWMLRATTMSVSSETQFFSNLCQSWTAFYAETSNDEVAKWAIDLVAIVPSYLVAFVLKLWLSNVVSTVLGGVDFSYCQEFLVRWISSLRGNKRDEAMQAIYRLLEDHNSAPFNVLLEWISSPASLIEPAEESVKNFTDPHKKNSANDLTVEEITQDLEGSSIGKENVETSVVAEIKKLHVEDADNENFCENLINTIYHSEDVQASFSGSFKNAVDLLSQMNSRDVHFVLEVIQNAADNEYPPSVQPTLIIELNKNDVTVKCNEVGFVEKNVRAICSVGKSHKKKTIGFIGHKGIGFKTVFAITDAPEIHSRGFHFRFDRSKQSLLAPYWIENTGDSWPVNDSSFTTRLVLPLNSEAKMAIEKLRSNLQLVFDKNLLLFLKRLSVMIFQDLSYGSASYKRLERITLFEHWTLCRQEDHDADDIWFVVKVPYLPTVTRRSDEKIEDIAETEVAVAIKFMEEKLNKNIYDEDDTLEEAVVAVEDIRRPRLQLQVSRQLMPLYSFLPTRMTAFRFILQADFVLVTNREAIEESHAYNKQLLDQAVTLIVQIFDELISFAQEPVNSRKASSKAKVSVGISLRPPCSRLQEICDRNDLAISPSSVLELIPRPEQTTSESLRAVSIAVCDQLRNKEIFQASNGEFVDASKLIIVHHLPRELRKVLSEETLFLFTGKRFLHPDLRVDDDLIKIFNITKLSTSTILDCLREFEQSLDENSTPIAGQRKATFQSRLKILQEMLIAVCQISEYEQRLLASSRSRTNTSTSAANRGLNPDAKAFTPTQVFRTNPASGAAVKTRSLTSEQLQNLKKLRIWPLKSEKFVSLLDPDHKTLFVEVPEDSEPTKKRTAFDRPLQLMAKCLELSSFRDSISVCNSKLFASNKMLLDFMLLHFKPNVGNEGLIELTPETFLTNVALPVLQNKEIMPNAPSDITGLLSFALSYYLSSKKPFPKKGVWIPVVSSKERTTKDGSPTISYTTDSYELKFLLPVGQEFTADGDSHSEIHFGPEFRNKSTFILGSVIGTALRQTEWKFLSPDVSAMLVFGASIEKPLTRGTVDSLNNVADALNHFPYLKDYTEMLRELGVINLVQLVKVPADGSTIATSMIRPKMVAFEKVMKQLLKSVEPVSAKNFYIKNIDDYTMSGSSPIVRIAEPYIWTALLEIWKVVAIAIDENKAYKAEILKAVSRYPTIPLKSSAPGYYAMLDVVFYTESSGQTWPHFPVVAPDFVTKTNICHVLDMKTVPQLETCPVEELKNIFLWMCQRKQFAANIAMMSSIYKRLSIDIAGKCFFDSQIETLGGEMRNSIQELGNAFIWLPNEVSKAARGSDAPHYVKGQMTTTDSIVLDDFKLENEKFALSFPGSPITVLSTVYPEEIVKQCFRRQGELCWICKAVEGPLAARGLPLGQPLSNPAHSHLSCSCKDPASLGLIFTPNRSGLLKNTAGAPEMLTVLQTLSRFAQNWDGEEQAVNSKEARELYQLIVRTFNRMVHRCATLREGLWPLSPADISFIAQEWYSQLSWPIYPNSWSTPGDFGTCKVLIIDDPEAFKTFKTTIESEYEDPILYLDFPTTLTGFGTKATAFKTHAESLSNFEDRHHQLLTQSSEYVIRAATTFQPALHPTCVLWDMYRNSYCLSDLISVSLAWQPNGTEETDCQYGLAELLGNFSVQYLNLWLAILAFLKSKRSDLYYGLQGSGPFRQFRAMEFAVVHQLSNRRTLNLYPFLHQSAGQLIAGDSEDNQLRFSKDEPIDYKLHEIESNSRMPAKYQLLMNVAMTSKGLTQLHSYLMNTIIQRFLIKLTNAEQREMRDCIMITRQEDEIERVWSRLDDYDVQPLDDKEVEQLLNENESRGIETSGNERGGQEEEAEEGTGGFDSSNLSKFYERIKQLKQEKLEREAKLRREAQLLREQQLREQREREHHEKEQQRIKQEKEKSSTIPIPAPQSTLPSKKNLLPKENEATIVDQNPDFSGTSPQFPSSQPLADSSQTDSAPSLTPPAGFEKRDGGDNIVSEKRDKNNDATPSNLSPRPEGREKDKDRSRDRDGTDTPYTPTSSNNDADKRKTDPASHKEKRDHGKEKLDPSSCESEGTQTEKQHHLSDIEATSPRPNVPETTPSSAEATASSEGTVPTAIDDLPVSADQTDQSDDSKSQAEQGSVPLAEQAEAIAVESADAGPSTPEDKGAPIEPQSIRKYGTGRPFQLMPKRAITSTTDKHFTQGSFSHDQDYVPTVFQGDNLCEVQEDFDAILQDIHVQNVTVDAMSPRDGDVSTIASIANLAHGRLGEELAHRLLQREFPSADWIVVWCNEESESGKPFDFIITRKSTDSTVTVTENIPVTRYIEVKTRVHNDRAISQWFISPSELRAAADHITSQDVTYSCLLIHLKHNNVLECGYAVQRMYFVDNLLAYDNNVKFLVHLGSSVV